jgi:tRNA-modifying protein YgfZ
VREVDAAIVERAFIRVSGPDAEAYLQGQLSQDVSGGAGLSWLLDPAGKAVAFLRFGPAGDVDGGFLLDTDRPAGDAVLARLRRFLLRTKAEVDAVDAMSLLRVFDGPRLPEAHPTSPWPDGSVQDVFAPDPLDVAAALGASVVDSSEYERWRILAGVPVSGVDVDGDTIPAEAGRWTIERGVSFTKGCYTGQELVARIDSRGSTTPRRLVGLRLDGTDVPSPGTSLVVDGQEVGRVTSAAAGGTHGGPVALAYLRRGIDTPAVVELGDLAGTAVDLPLAAD